MAEPSEPETDKPQTDLEPEDDPQTAQAVDDITRSESDDELKAQDAAAGQATPARPPQEQGRFKRAWHNWWADPRKRRGSVAAIIVVGALFAIPITRYNILGTVLRVSVTVQAIDSQTGAPVSSAMVQLSGQAAETQADGKATLRVNMGSGVLKVSKKYYGTYSHGELVGSGNGVVKVRLVALGRQVQVRVVNKITGKPVAGAKVTAGDASAKTGKSGLATVVLPSGATTQAATVALSGYNNAKVTIDANGDLAKDTFAVTPAGKLYFLSNLSGTIDVVKTNLDGSGRATVLAGTGHEDLRSTSLLASRDWKYLALLAKRGGDNASLYLIDTTNGDKLTTIDQGDADFNLVGWSGDRFVYQVNRHSVLSWQTGQEALKSFDPSTGHTLLLDQTQASGSGSTQYAGQFLGTPYLIGNQVVYVKGWQADSFNYATELSGKTPELDTIGADGSGHRVVKSFTVVNSNYLNVAAELYEPGALYLRTFNNGQSTFYTYENGKVSDAPDMTDDTFENTPYTTYLLSPSGDKAFWAAQRDGKNTLFTGGADAADPKQIASLSDYNTYGWYTDNYLLVSKNSSELYIMPATGGTPLKITDYYKPAINYQGYGGGYGGL